MDKQEQSIAAIDVHLEDGECLGEKTRKEKRVAPGGVLYVWDKSNTPAKAGKGGVFSEVGRCSVVRGGG